MPALIVSAVIERSAESLKPGQAQPAYFNVSNRFVPLTFPLSTFDPTHLPPPSLSQLGGF